MSETVLYGFGMDGNAYRYSEVHNGFRSAMAVWEIMEEKYLPPYIPEYVKKRYGDISFEKCVSLLSYKPTRLIPTLSDGNVAAKEVWDLVNNLDVPVQERICMATTFDNYLVKREDIPKVIEAFRSFEGKTSLSEQADILEELLEECPDCIAIGWNQTSVNSGWTEKGGYDEEHINSLPYNCLTGDVHFWLFDDLETVKEG